MSCWAHGKWMMCVTHMHTDTNTQPSHRQMGNFSMDTQTQAHCKQPKMSSNTRAFLLQRSASNGLSPHERSSTHACSLTDAFAYARTLTSWGWVVVWERWTPTKLIDLLLYRHPNLPHFIFSTRYSMCCDIALQRCKAPAPLLSMFCLSYYWWILNTKESTPLQSS